MVSKLGGRSIIIVTGCGASGTRYTSKFLMNIGVGTPHEVLGAEGIVSWYFAPGYRVVGSPYRSSLPLRNMRPYFKKVPYIIHQVRHPLKTISSIQVSNRRSINFIRDITGYDIEEEGVLKFFMLYWLHWNKMVEKLAVARIRIEKFENDIKPVLILTGNQRRVELVDKSMSLLSTKENSKKKLDKYISRSWDDLLNEDEFLTGRIIDTANNYGYKINKDKIMKGN